MPLECYLPKTVVPRHSHSTGSEDIGSSEGSFAPELYSAAATIAESAIP